MKFVVYRVKLIKTGPSFIESVSPEQAGLGHFKTPLRPLSAVEDAFDDVTDTQKSQPDQNKEKHHD